MVIFLLLSLHFYNLQGLSAFAFSPMDIVINEIAWAGTQANSNHEWIELYNNTNQTIDLSGWEITDDTDTHYIIDSGFINANSFYIIEDSEDVLSQTADSIIGLSLSNTGDKLELKDNLNNTIDTVNSTGGAWYAGDSVSKSSMERIDPKISGDLDSNWATNISSSSILDSLGNYVNASPKSVNSVFVATSNILNISPKDVYTNTGDQITFTVSIENGENVLGYGLNIQYDPSVLKFISATEDNYLNSDGTITSFIYGLENNIEGKIMLADARMGANTVSKSGSGDLFTVIFQAQGIKGSSSALKFSSDSFISSESGDLPFLDDETFVNIDTINIESVENLKVDEGTENYSLNLTWTDPSNSSDSFIIYKKNVAGEWAYLSETSGLDYTDSFDLIPGINYEYRVLAQKAGKYSLEALVVGMDSRGLNGDINRDLTVNARDLIELAKHYSAGFSEENYINLADLNYDAIIDGQDLINLASNFALTI